jgi:hypothetical protein
MMIMIQRHARFRWLSWRGRRQKLNSLTIFETWFVSAVQFGGELLSRAVLNLKYEVFYNN